MALLPARHSAIRQAFAMSYSGAALLGTVLLGSAPAMAETFVFDKEHTEVRFSWNHLGMSRQSGQFADIRGALTFDTEKPEASSVEVSIPVAKLQTGVPALDTVLIKSKDYFDAAAHPTITFKSSSVRMTGERSAEVQGDLTINGVSKPATLAVVLNFVGPHPLAAVNPSFNGKIAAGFSARTQILRSDWGMSRLVPLVSDEIRISIEAELEVQP